MSSRLYGLYGASGFGEEIMYWFARQLERSGDTSRVVYIDDGSEKSVVNGFEVLKYQAFIAQPEIEKFVSIAIANSVVREKLDQMLQRDGVRQIPVCGDYSFVRGATLAEGSILSAYVDITANVRIGRCFHANTYSYVGHDCVIGDYVTFAPRVSCNGNVHIEDHAYIGTGAILKQGTPDKPLVIGRGAVVGMGAVVTKSVPAGVTVVGNPARPLVK
jgi:sugar O-acyltransferase (sialic acid O-acetyltransferase NeuD family)